MGPTSGGGFSIITFWKLVASGVNSDIVECVKQDTSKSKRHFQRFLKAKRLYGTFFGFALITMSWR